jgi:hypothetical protein
VLIDRSNPKFEPSADVLSAMTYVRRKELGSLVHTHGLFGEYKAERDLLLFAIVIGLEIYLGSFIAQRVGINSTLFYALFIIFLDFVFAFYHQKYHCPRVLDVRKTVVDIEVERRANKPDPQETARLRDQYSRAISKDRTIGFLCSAALIAFAFAKAYFAYEANRSKINDVWGTQAGIIAAIAIVHLFFSGYAMRYIIANGYWGLWGFSKDHAKYSGRNANAIVGLQAKARMIELDFSAFENLKGPGVIAQVREHSIVNLGSEIQLQTLGVLYNDDIQELMHIFQPQKTKTEIAMKGLYMQSYAMGVGL